MTAVINKSDNASPWRIKRCSKFRRNWDNGWPICGNFTFLIKRLVCSWVCISKLGCFSLIAGSEFIYDTILVFSYARMQKFNLQKNKKKRRKKIARKKGNERFGLFCLLFFHFRERCNLRQLQKHADGIMKYRSIDVTLIFFNQRDISARIQRSLLHLERNTLFVPFVLTLLFVRPNSTALINFHCFANLNIGFILPAPFSHPDVLLFFCRNLGDSASAKFD